MEPSIGLLRHQAPCVGHALRELEGVHDVLAAFETLRHESHPWLLDSALEGGRLGRFSFAGADPYLVLRASGRSVSAHVRRAALPDLAPGLWRWQGDPLDALRALLPRAPHCAPDAPLPFVGGAIGGFGYELAAQIEALEFAHSDVLGLPDLTLLFVDRMLAFDHRTRKLFASALGFARTAGEAAARANEAAETLARRVRAAARAARAEVAPGPDESTPIDWQQPRALPAAAAGEFDERSYRQAVEAARAHIAAGDAYQVCLTHRLEVPCAGDAWQLYRRLRRVNPAPFAAYLELPEASVLSSSPERFLRLERDGSVESRPIKGTRPRGKTHEEDAALERALRRSAKDRAENVMIVDLVRNDLGRVCETGSIHVHELAAIERYASVFQMVSTVRGRLRGDRDVVDLLRAAFPPGSMTGAPKLAAMRIAERLERARRGLYAGALGWLDVRGGADLSVVIRALLVQRGRAWLQVGGGIVADSDPLDEWCETQDKARALLAALSTEPT